MKRYLIYISNRHNSSIANYNIKRFGFRQSTKKVIQVKKTDCGLTLIKEQNKSNENHEKNVNKDNGSKISNDSSNKSHVDIKQKKSSYVPKFLDDSFYVSLYPPYNKENIKQNKFGTLKIFKDMSKKHLDENVKTDGNVRINEINIQMLPKSLHEHIFKNCSGQETVSEKEIKTIKNNLNSFGIKVKDASRLPEVDIKIPPLEGDDIEQHFYNIGQAQIKPYVNIIENIMKKIPEMPKEWVLREGWTRYTADGVEFVDYPLEDGIIFDVEVCMKEGPLPTLATAVTDQAWYGWVSKSLANGSSRNFEGKKFTMNELVPMESTAEEYGESLSSFHKKPKIVISHNASYDRNRIKEQYWLKNTGLRFIDTMSLHISISGINSYQRSILNSKKETDEKLNLLMQTSLNSLTEIHKFYCGSTISKDSRNIFVKGTLADIKQDFNSLMIYCANDVIATHNILCHLFPLFTSRFPHPVTLAGMLELGTAYLPTNSNWERYLSESESVFEDLDYETKFILAKRANTVCQLMHNEQYKKDLWMWSEDWSTKELRVKKRYPKLKPLKTEIQRAEEKELNSEKHLTKDEEDEEEEDPLDKEFAYLKKTKKLLPTKLPHMPGYPAWYAKLCPKPNDADWAPGPQNISTSMKIVPKLLNLTWENYPLHHIKDLGWGILVPYTNNLNVETKIPLKELLAQCSSPTVKYSNDETEYTMSTLDEDVEGELHKTEFWRYKKVKVDQLKDIYNGSAIWCNTDIDNCCYFLKLPHPNGERFNVGNPLSKDFLNKFSEHVLGGMDDAASEILKNSMMMSYWRNNKARIMSQFVVWFENHNLPSTIKRTKNFMNYGAILPVVVVSGTLTRRAVEPTWMTASNVDSERVGSELRAMIQAPPGYNIVGADVDSQELWISSIIGDAHYKKIHGATPFGWMTLIGNKANETDMHSVTAKAVGISRSHAKIINYARIYGAGTKFAERLLKQFNPCMTDSEAASKARKMFTMTKGKKVYQLKPEYTDYLVDKQYSTYEAYQTCKLHGKELQDMFEKSKWVGGSESAMFNRLEEIAQSPQPMTPFLNSRLSSALEGETNNEKYLPTKVNWVVQSGAVDFLHLMLVSMKWLMKDNIRFCLSFHDEVRYLVESNHKYHAALAMHVTNLLTRSFCASRLGMRDLPMSVAFFNSVEVDTVLRKESTNDCVTPSNPHGLKNGYNIPAGESLDVWTAVQKAKGSLGPWHKTKKVVQSE